MASQQLFTLNPSYSGPMVIADNLRKMKTNSGLNRMLSTHNKRFFILDLNHMTFYYLPDRTSHFANSTNIPLASITGIKVTKQAKGLEEDKVWKYEFVITTKKKMFELITDSKTIMDKFLFAFANIINIKTNQPLFNWGNYTGESQSQSSSPSNLPLHTQVVEGFNQEHTENLNTSPQSSPSKQSERDEDQYQNLDAADLITPQPQQTGETSPEVARMKEAIKIKAILNDNKDSDGQSDDQKENKQQELNGLKKGTASVTVLRRKASGLATTRGKGFEMTSENQKPEVSPSRGMDASPISEITPVMDSPTGFRGFDVRETLPEPQQVEKLQINLKMNFQKIEDGPVEKKKPESYQEINRRATPGDLSARRRPNYDLNMARNHKSFSMKNMVPRVEERRIVGLNEADLSHHMKKSTLKSSQNFEELQRTNMSGAVSSRIRLGTGVSMSHVRSQVVDQNSDSSPFGQESKKFSLLKEVDMRDSPLKKENPIANKKSLPVNDDDWDNDMFGYGKGQLSPLKPNKEGNQKLSSGSKYSLNEKKPHQQLSQRRIEFVSSRQGTHNDWDDDL